MSITNQNAITQTENPKIQKKSSTNEQNQKNIENEKKKRKKTLRKLKIQKKIKTMAAKIRERMQPQDPYSADLKFLVEETCRDLKFGGRRRLEARIKSLREIISPKDMTQILEGLHPSQTSLKFDIINYNNLTDAEILEGIKAHLAPEQARLCQDLINAQEDLTTVVNRIHTLHSLASHLPTDKNEAQTVARALPDTSRKLKDITHKVIALTHSNNVRIIGRRLYLPEVTSAMLSDANLKQILHDKYAHVILLDKDLIQANVTQIFTQQAFQVKGNYEKSFSFQQPSNTQKGIIAESVIYKDRPDPRSFFQNFFLQKADSLIEWKEISRSNDRVTAHAVVSLGQTQLPPQRLTPDAWSKSNQSGITEWENFLYNTWVPLLKDSSADSPIEAAEISKFVDTELRDWGRAKAIHKETVGKEATNPHRPKHDP